MQLGLRRLDCGLNKHDGEVQSVISAFPSSASTAAHHPGQSAYSSSSSTLHSNPIELFLASKKEPRKMAAERLFTQNGGCGMRSADVLSITHDDNTERSKKTREARLFHKLSPQLLMSTNSADCCTELT